MEKLNLKSKELSQVYFEKLSKEFPECIVENTFDFDKLKKLVGLDFVEKIVGGGCKSLMNLLG
ncbi:site-specific DNA-methyltransferase (Type III DNA modification enzyme) [Oceanivirga salmonicida]|uniref:site-specific DNA-methyltransferase (Type III DNA modification enzyme) n=1 Tax=Oceanivirga salmonicida TaxID=1769291 RepID=UPI0012E1A836|nr:site-specific DNA-methyltransferase (Type III DNA modification enzyme) [Oceanivirga salmonicida]